MGRMTVGALILAVVAPFPAAGQFVDYHKAQQAGKVWRDKITDNNRDAARRTAQQRRQAAAADARWDAPLSQADLAGTRARNRAEYDRKLKLGQGFADRWLDRTARLERDRRQRGIRTASVATSSAGTAARPLNTAAGCTADALPPDERRGMEAEFNRRIARDGRPRAVAWLKTQANDFKLRMQAQGVRC